MYKICTDQEQSKKLIELGLSTKTADMRYEYSSREKDEIQNPIVGFHLSSIKYFESTNYVYLPAWSLSALLDLMPKYVVGYSPSIRKDEDFYCCVYSDWNGEDFIWFNGDTPIDAAYNMVIWLIEQGYIKTEKK